MAIWNIRDSKECGGLVEVAVLVGMWYEVKRGSKQIGVFIHPSVRTISPRRLVSHLNIGSHNKWRA